MCLGNKIRKGGFLLLLAVAWEAGAQQTIADYNLLDRTNKLSCVPENPTLSFLNDKDDGSFFVISDFSGTPTITYESDVPVVVTAFSLVSGDEENADLKSFRLKGSNDGVAWTNLASALGASFPGRYQALITQVTRKEAFKYFQLDLRGVAGGKLLKIAEFQLLGYPQQVTGLLSETSGNLTGQYPGNNNDRLENLLSLDYSKKFRQNDTPSFWADFAFHEPTSINAYSLTTTLAEASSSQIRSWELLASHDGSDWVLLDERSNKNLFEADNNSQVYFINDPSKACDWAMYADSAHHNMMRMFWKPYGSGYYLTHDYHPNPASTNTGYNYWWMAHALDVFIDAYNRTGDNTYITYANQVYRAQLSYGNNSLKNGFFDDMEWMGLACLRAYEASNTPRWKEAAIDLWNWIKLGWNDHHGGGIQWVDVQPASKNACSNAPAIILAARLYQLTGDQDYLDWALRIFDWMNASLILPNGIVMDGYGNDNWGWTFTYNQGTWIGACLELFKITGEQKYYDIAMLNADFVVNDREKFSPHGILYNNEGGGDGGLFKGIFLRYLSQWLLSGKLDDKRQERFSSYVVENGIGLWQSATQKPQIIFGNTWLQRPNEIKPKDPTKSGYDASIHLSGVMLFELLDELKRNGVLPESQIQGETVPYRQYRLKVNSNKGGNQVELSKWQLFNEANSGVESLLNNSSYIEIQVHGKTLILAAQKEESFSFRLFDITGSMLASGLVTGKKEIDLKPGIYIVSTSTGKQTYNKKISIQ